MIGFTKVYTLSRVAWVNNPSVLVILRRFVDKHTHHPLLSANPHVLIKKKKNMKNIDTVTVYASTDTCVELYLTRLFLTEIPGADPGICWGWDGVWGVDA